MKKLCRPIFALVSVLALAGVVSAQVITDPPTGGGTTTIVSGTTPITGGGTTQLCFNDAAFISCGDAGLTYNKTTDFLSVSGGIITGSVSTAGRSILTIKDTHGAGSILTDNFLNITGTLPTVLTQTVSGVSFIITSAGSSAFSPTAGLAQLAAGYTGAQTTTGWQGANATAGTKNNNGLVGTSTAITTGNNFGMLSSASQSSTWNSGAFVNAGNASNAPALNTGIAGWANNATINAAGAFFLGVIPTAPTAPTIPVSSAVYADNLSSGQNIIVGANNGTVVQALQTGGSLYSKMGTKALTLGGGAVTFVRVAVTSNSFQGGFIDYCADANDATDYQTRCGIVPFSIVNKGGTETCTVATTGAATESVAASAGTFTVAFTTDTATPTNGCDFQANGTSSLTETVMRINYTVRLVGNAATAVTPQ